MQSEYILQTPVGPARATVSDGAVTAFEFAASQGTAAGSGVNDDAARQLQANLDEYFAGRLPDPERGLRLAPRGTAFQLAVWAELSKIPSGTLITYARLAQRCGRPRACRAAGAACGVNPIALLIPCHRVVGSDGGLHGYAYGVEVKRALIELEAKWYGKHMDV